jgi:hypothetical protein
MIDSGSVRWRQSLGLVFSGDEQSPQQLADG